jgi:hypothetical protein
MPVTAHHFLNSSRWYPSWSSLASSSIAWNDCVPGFYSLKVNWETSKLRNVKELTVNVPPGERMIPSQPFVERYFKNLHERELTLLLARYHAWKELFFPSQFEWATPYNYPPERPFWFFPASSAHILARMSQPCKTTVFHVLSLAVLQLSGVAAQTADAVCLPYFDWVIHHYTRRNSSPHFASVIQLSTPKSMRSRLESSSCVSRGWWGYLAFSLKRS